MKTLTSLLTLLIGLSLSAQDVQINPNNIEEILGERLNGPHNIHIGIGYPNLIAQGIQVFDEIPSSITRTFIEGEGSGTPQFHISYDYGITQNLSLGAYFGYVSATTPTFNWNIPSIEPIPILLPNGLEARDGAYTYDISIRSFGIRGVYHLLKDRNSRFHLYLTGVAGWNQVKIIENGVTPEGEDTGLLGDLIGIDDATEELVNVPVPEFAYSGQLGGQVFLTPNIGLYLELGYGMNILNAGLSFQLGSNKWYPQ